MSLPDWGKRSDLLNKNLILWEDTIAKKLLAAFEFSPLEFEMKVVYLQVASRAAGGDVLGSCFTPVSSREKLFSVICFFFFFFIKRKTKKQQGDHMSTQEKHCSSLPHINKEGSVLLFTVHVVQARISSTEKKN